VIKKIILGLLAILVGAQFIHPEKNVAPAGGPNDISARHPVPSDVQGLLQRACYDCHSNRTYYPWYAEIQPVGWWLASHVNDGKRHLNFSEFGTYSAKRTVSKLDEISEDVSQHAMPLQSYTWAHPEARLTPAEVNRLADWAENLRDEIAPR
jgi:hypothetical protein